MLLLLLLLARHQPKVSLRERKEEGVHAQKILLDASTRAHINTSSTALFWQKVNIRTLHKLERS